MLKLALASFLKHLQDQNIWSHALLEPYAGQSVLIDAQLISTHWVILENGQLTVAGETASPDAAISITPTTLLRLAAKDDDAKKQINISGDTQLAAALAKVMANLQWDIADDLSHLIGGVASEKLVTSTKHVVNSTQSTVHNLGEMAIEYLTEELMLLAKPRHVQDFNQKVDLLKADTARLEKKIQKLNARLDSTLTSTSAK